MSQQQSAASRSIPKRLEALRLAKKFTWDGMATLLEISPSMIYQVKRGERNLGDLVMHRLEEAEIAEGLLDVQDASFARLLRNPEVGKALDSANDPAKKTSHDNYIEMRLEVLVDIVDTYDSGRMDLLLNRLKTLAASDKQFGKVFDQLAQVVAHLQIRKQRKEESETPRQGAKKK
jgi:transcriptional regulator with XRE-family HTH domain